MARLVRPASARQGGKKNRYGPKYFHAAPQNFREIRVDLIFLKNMVVLLTISVGEYSGD
jgi:hypothetical protein